MTQLVVAITVVFCATAASGLQCYTNINGTTRRSAEPVKSDFKHMKEWLVDKQAHTYVYESNTVVPSHACYVTSTGDRGTSTGEDSSFGMIAGIEQRKQQVQRKEQE